MESRLFIRQATALIQKLESLTSIDFTREEADQMYNECQKEFNFLFQGLQNPTLPSAGKLCQAGIAAGLTVDQRLINKLNQAESLWT
jgi:hypothetical protein